jgi:hypothetical protein
MATFTVKHELRNWVQRYAYPEDLRFYRCRDSRPGDAVTEMTLQEVLNGR